ncbi:expressed unknown protein [Seminavis robusta]|uniref:Uncharacterized protein n=1 Tax=Seminavis robusta TaxID=568900 RepID=A0A9N8EZK4_9STRA|nr:expressed unknown protein [Seminavis robusta]|eukprot:Sro2274_g321590.1 n/a (234) ;mRNA; f:12732-13433
MVISRSVIWGLVLLLGHSRAFAPSTIRSRTTTSTQLNWFRVKSTEPELSDDQVEAMYDDAYRAREELVAKAVASAETAEDDAKFGFGARIESFKCLVVGAFSGGIALAPVSLIRDCAVAQKSLAQWEFDTDAGALEAALFAIVYRYCIREDTNPQLKDGVVGAFVLTRTLTRIELPSYCSAVPVDCGPPLGYLDWNVLGQLLVNGIQSGILFAAAASGMEYCFRKNYISKFPG